MRDKAITTLEIILGPSSLFDIASRKTTLNTEGIILTGNAILLSINQPNVNTCRLYAAGTLLFSSKYLTDSLTFAESLLAFFRKALRAFVIAFPMKFNPLFQTEFFTAAPKLAASEYLTYTNNKREIAIL